jgi:hypothetical protein
VTILDQSRPELTAVVQSVQTMGRAGNDSAAAVRATSGVIEALEPLVPRFRANFPVCSIPPVQYPAYPAAPTAPVDAVAAVEQLGTVARTLAALSASPSLVRDEEARVGLNKVAKIVQTIGAATGRHNFFTLTHSNSLLPPVHFCWVKSKILYPY